MNPMPIGRTVMLALAAVAIMAAPASAQGGLSPAQRQAARACMPDMQAYCAGVERGGGRVLACLRQNGERLSPDCRQALSSLQR